MSDAQRREIIRKAAERLLSHYGPQKTTIADVAREAGVGVGTVYLEFPSKEALVEELSSARYGAVLEAMRAATRAEGRTWGERLVGAIDARLSAYLAHAGEGAHACDLFHCSNPAVKSASERFHEDERALVAGILREGTLAGELDVAEPELGARAILRAYGSFTPPWIFMGEKDDLFRLIAAVHAIVLRGVLRRELWEKPQND
jgi:AcrR family transcriptional regulator